MHAYYTNVHNKCTAIENIAAKCRSGWVTNDKMLMRHVNAFGLCVYVCVCMCACLRKTMIWHAYPPVSDTTVRVYLHKRTHCSAALHFKQCSQWCEVFKLSTVSTLRKRWFNKFFIQKYYLHSWLSVTWDILDVSHEPHNDVGNKFARFV